MRLQRFFRRQGSKLKYADLFVPLTDTVIEPMCGSASYSLSHYKKRIILNDIDPTIVGVWDWLIKCSSSEISSLPDTINEISDLTKVCEEAKNFIGLCLDQNKPGPVKQCNAWSYWGAEHKAMVLKQKPYISHWIITCKSYEEIPDYKGTWIIDPIYQTSHSRRYKYGSAHDYLHLAEWCKSRESQVVVFEKEGAEWLPFKPSSLTCSSAKGKFYNEVIWYKNCGGRLVTLSM